MTNNQLNASKRVTMRLEINNKPRAITSLAIGLARKKLQLASMDIVSVTRKIIICDVTLDVDGADEGNRVIAYLHKIQAVSVIFEGLQDFIHRLGGKILAQIKFPIKTNYQPPMFYKSGEKCASKAIAEERSKVYVLTPRNNRVAIVSDGSDILFFGDWGAHAALPVIEAKAEIFKEFSNIDAWPICLGTPYVDEIAKTVLNIAPMFGGIFLTNISAPRCFEIESQLKNKLDIPVIREDQHGTAVIVLAALKNALKVVKKDIREVHVVLSGLGSEGLACYDILLKAGVQHLLGCNREGVALVCDPSTQRLAQSDLFDRVQEEEPILTLREALTGADVFIAVSAGNVLMEQTLEVMEKNRIVFVLANSDLEEDHYKAMKSCRIFATGRSDFPNQIDNALVLPGIFQGVLNVRAKTINEEMKLAAAEAIANLISPEQLSEERILPSLFDKRVVQAVASAVAEAAHNTGVAYAG